MPDAPALPSYASGISEVPLLGPHERRLQRHPHAVENLHDAVGQSPRPIPSLFAGLVQLKLLLTQSQGCVPMHRRLPQVPGALESMLGGSGPPPGCSTARLGCLQAKGGCLGAGGAGPPYTGLDLLDANDLEVLVLQRRSLSVAFLGRQFAACGSRVRLFVRFPGARARFATPAVGRAMHAWVSALEVGHAPSRPNSAAPLIGSQALPGAGSVGLSFRLATRPRWRGGMEHSDRGESSGRCATRMQHVGRADRI